MMSRSDDKEEIIRRSVYKGIRILLLLLIVIFIYVYKPARHISIDVFDYARAAVNPQFHNETLKLRQAGLPVSLVDFDRDPPPADAINSANIYILLSDDKKYPDKDEPYALGRLALTDKDTRETIRRYIQTHKDLFKLAHKAVICPEYYYSHRSAPSPFDINYKVCRSCRRVARLISMESLNMAESGYGAKAVENQAFAFKTADHAACDIGQESWIIAISCQQIAFRGMQNLMTITHGDPKVAKSIIMSMDQYYHPINLKAACKSQLAIDCAEVDYALNYNRKSIVNPNWDIAGVYMITVMRQAIESCDLPYSQSNPIFMKLDKDVSSKHGFTPFFVSINRSLPEYRANLLSQAAITRAAANVFIYKSKHESFPETLAQAMPSVPMDPFNDKPLNYRREGKGFVVYSVGETGTYDGTPILPTYHISPAGKKVEDSPKRHEQFYRYEE